MLSRTAARSGRLLVRQRACVQHLSSTTTPSSSTDWEYDYDVLVVGGGVVGAALAAKLAMDVGQAGMKVALVEGRAPPPLAHLMVSAIAHCHYNTVASSHDSNFRRA
jgi:hypothetical protein